MLVADAARLACDSGTILGREVVPEVCSTIEMSSAAPAAGARWRCRGAVARRAA
jgi:hypothetical protein